MRWKKRVNQSLAIALTVALAFAMNVPIAAWGEVQDPVLDVPGAEPASLAESTAAQQFEALVAELPEANAVTAEDADAVSAAQAAYDALAEDEKVLVNASCEKLDAVLAAFAALSTPKASDVETQAFEAMIGSQGYSTLADAVSAAQSGSTVVLQGNAALTETLNIDKGLTIEGSGFTVTAEGLAPAIQVSTSEPVVIKNLTLTGVQRGIKMNNSAVNLALTGCTINASLRGIDSPSLEYSGISLVLDNTAINCSDVSDYDTQVKYDQSCRGISLWNIKDSQVILKNSSSINGFSYCINVSGAQSESGVCDTTGLKVDVVDSTLHGWTGLNIWGSSAVYTIKGSTVKGINTSSAPSNSFAAIVFNDDIYDQFAQAHSVNNTLTIADSTITNFQGGSCTENLLRIDCGITKLILSGEVKFADTTGNIAAALQLDSMDDPYGFLQKNVQRDGEVNVVCTAPSGAELPFSPAYVAHYYWPNNNGGTTGVNCADLTDIFTGNGYTLCNGESIDLLSDAALSQNVVVALSEGVGEFALNLKGHRITGGTISLPAGTSVKTDVQNTDVFVAAEGCELKERVDDAVYVYTSVQSTAVAQIGEGEAAKKFETLQAAINAAQSGDTVKLLSNVDLGDAPRIDVIDKELVLDLAGFTLTRSGGVIATSNSVVTVKNGSIVGLCLNSTNGAEFVSAITAGRGSKLTIAADAKISGPFGIGIGALGKTEDAATAGEGTVIEVYGTVCGTDEASALEWSGTGAITINGNVTSLANHATVHVRPGAKLVGTRGTDQNINYATGPAIYAAGYGEWIIDEGAALTGDEPLSIKAGKFTINGGTFTAQGEYCDPVTAHDGGSEATGAAISITKNGSYAGQVSMEILGGTFVSENGFALFETDSKKYPGSPMAPSSPLLNKGGTFSGKMGALSVKHATGFVQGGTFSSDPSAYVATGYAATQDGGTWTVAACSFAEMTIDGTAKTYNDPQAFIGDLMGAAGKTIGIKMLADVDVDGFIPVAEGQTVTLDMGGKKLTSSYAGSFIRNSGTLTIQGDGIICTTDIEAQGRHAVENYGTLIIENGTFSSNKSRGNAVRNFGTATIKGGTFTACDNFTNGGYAYAVANGSSAYPNATMTVENATVQGNMNGAIACDGGTLTIKNGSYTLGDGTADSLYRLAYVSGNGTVNIEGGTFVRNVKNNHGFFGGGDGNEGTTEGINISGGTFTDQVNEAINFDSGRTRISGGTFEKGLVSGKKATVTVTGGTFAADPLKDGFVADGYVVKPGDKGAFVVSQATDADKIQVTDENGNTVDAVGTMGDAVDRVAKTGGTLTLMGDATEIAPIAVEPAAGSPSTSVSIDLNGKALNASLTIGQNATCTITDKTGVGTVSAAGSNAAVEVSGALVVNGATIVGAGTSGVKVNPGASLTVNGGEVQAQTQPATFSLPLAAAATAGQYGIEATGTQDNPSTVTISAGKVLGATGALSVGENVTTDITGGTFSHSVASLLASGYAESEVGGLFYVAKDGMYEVSAYKADPADSATWAYPDGAQGQVFAGWYADSAFRTPFTAASGQAYARFVNVSETITFKGGSLRMDGDPSASTSLRFGYSFKIPQQATYVKSGWTYRNANLGKEVDVPTRVWAFNDTGFFDANMVITNIPTSSYAWEMTSQMYVYYETADGTTVRAEEAAPQSRSAQSVAQFIVDSSFAPTIEKEYAQKILVAIV